MKNSEILKKAVLISGAVSAASFILSLIAYINWPRLFLPLAIAMACFAVVFLILRSIYNYRETFRVRSGNTTELSD